MFHVEPASSQTRGFTWNDPAVERHVPRGTTRQAERHVRRGSTAGPWRALHMRDLPPGRAEVPRGTARSGTATASGASRRLPLKRARPVERGSFRSAPYRGESNGCPTGAQRIPNGHVSGTAGALSARVAPGCTRSPNSSSSPREVRPHVRQRSTRGRFPRRVRLSQRRRAREGLCVLPNGLRKGQLRFREPPGTGAADAVKQRGNTRRTTGSGL